ncbi:INO80 complex subunit C [Nematocida major]|uniref:INO80 complex subunit C n=1 Tax=Nematocida major TaxID=1912982 RepID=UPI0020081EC7|nr:INO80 complex subunit C [Nematocida major]KAH9386984.1 INO80 complex subunit C [Nematocida major]
MSERKSKTLKQLQARIAAESPLYTALFNKVSIQPQLQLCDITGLPAKYVCPRTGLRYSSCKVYARLREVTTEVAQSMGSLRQVGKELSMLTKK